MKRFAKSIFLLCFLLLLSACSGSGEGALDRSGETLSGGNTVSQPFGPAADSEIHGESGIEELLVSADRYRIRDFCFFDDFWLLLELESLSERKISYGWLSVDGELSYDEIGSVVPTGKEKNMYGVPFFYDREKERLFTGDAVYQVQMGSLEPVLQIPPACQREIRYNGAKEKCVYVDSETFELKVLDIGTGESVVIDQPQVNPTGDEWHPFIAYPQLSGTKDDFVFYWSIFADGTAQLCCRTLQGQLLYAISSYSAPYPLTYRIDCLEQGFVFRCAQEYEEDGAILGRTQLDFYNDDGELIGQRQMDQNIQEILYLEDQGKAVVSISKEPEDPAEIFSYEIQLANLDTMECETIVKDRLVRKLVVSPDQKTVFWLDEDDKICSASLSDH